MNKHRIVASLSHAPKRRVFGALIGVLMLGSAGGAFAASSGGVPTVGTACGQYPSSPVGDPDHVVAALPPAQRAGFAGYPITVHKSPWSNYAGAKKPWKIAYSNGSLGNGFGLDTFHTTQADFNALKAKGAVTGSLLADYQSTLAQQSPALQVAGYQRLVNEGANLIIVLPIAGPPMAAEVTAAGKKGVVTVSYTGAIPSPYDITVQNNPYVVGAQAVAGTVSLMGDKGNLVIMRGISSLPIDQAEYAATIATLKNCPNVHVVGTINAMYTPASAKASMLTFLASHPQAINGVVQLNTMSTGVVEAFQQAGRPVPVVDDPVDQYGLLAFWKQNIKTFKSIGSIANGVVTADAAFRTGVRVLAGNKIKMDNISVVPPSVTESNFQGYVKPGSNLQTPGEVIATPGTYLPNNYLDAFFQKPGPGVAIPPK